MQEFGFVIPGRPIFVDDIRVRGIGSSQVYKSATIPQARGPPPVEMVFNSYSSSTSLVIYVDI